MESVGRRYNHMTKEIAKRRREETAVGGSASAERVGTASLRLFS